MIPVEKYDFASAEVDYRAGGWSINALAAKYAIPEPSLRRHAKKNGWVAGNSEAKRELVKEAMAGVPLPTLQPATNALTSDERVRQVQVSEAEQDVRDMNTGLSVARACMGKLLAMVEQVDHPKEVKLIVEANKAAVDTIRKIRALDEEQGPEASVSVEISDGFADLRAAFKRRLETVTVASDDADA
jgi:DNA-binding MurR/RpiR family transcriptional regulator